MDNARIHHHEDITALVESYSIVTLQFSSLVGSSFIYQVTRLPHRIFTTLLPRLQSNRASIFCDQILSSLSGVVLL